MSQIPSLFPNLSGLSETYKNSEIDARDYLSWFKKQFDTQLFAFLFQKKQEAREISPELTSLVDELIRFSDNGGKRVRPAFMYSGYVSAGGQSQDAILYACASVELLHVFALIHDDLMDNSSLRRGQLTTHKQFEKLHSEKKLSGSAENFGLSSAILIGDLAYAFAEEILTSAPFPQERLRRARYFFDQMKTQVIYGQYLDVLGGHQDSMLEEDVLKVLEYKTAKYTVERPLHIGAILAGADYQLLETFSRYGIPFGQAFQIQDDIVGTFATEKEIGKPNDSDIKEGKKTLLLVKAWEKASTNEREVLKQVVGNSQASAGDVKKVRQIFEKTGARDYCLKLALQLLKQAKSAVHEAKIKPEGKNYLLAAAQYLEKRF